MSSAAILATIRQKQSELSKLEITNTQITQVYNSVDCMAFKFKQAGALISDAGTIGGKPFDNGATVDLGNNMSGISNNALELLLNIKTTIANLNEEISKLWEQYYAALAAEAAALEAEKKKKQ